MLMSMATKLFSKLGGIDPENCYSIEPPSYASTAYVVGSYGPCYFPPVSLKFWKLARIFWANGLPPPPPGKKIARTPMNTIIKIAREPGL